MFTQGALNEDTTYVGRRKDEGQLADLTLSPAPNGPYEILERHYADHSIELLTFES